MAEVNPGTRMNDLSIAVKNVDTAGDPYVACQNLTNSAAESKRTADTAECANVGTVQHAAAVDNVLMSIIHSPALTSLSPWNTVLFSLSKPVTKSAQ